MSTKESGEKFLQEGLGPEREDIDFDLESLFRETVLSSIESQEGPMDGDKPVAADVLTDIIEEAYGEETNREGLVSTGPEESMAEEVLRFVNPSVHHGDEVEGRPKRLRPSVTRWMGREILDEDPDWENILLSQEDERLREDYDDPEQKFYDELDRLSLAGIGSYCTYRRCCSVEYRGFLLYHVEGKIFPTGCSKTVTKRKKPISRQRISLSTWETG